MEQSTYTFAIGTTRSTDGTFEVDFNTKFDITLIHAVNAICLERPVLLDKCKGTISIRINDRQFTAIQYYNNFHATCHFRWPTSNGNYVTPLLKQLQCDYVHAKYYTDDAGSNIADYTVIAKLVDLDFELD